MRTKRLVLVAFLVALYIVPAILAPSVIHTATPIQDNKVKDFQVASWYDATFQYRQNVTITGSTGAGTDYQVRIDVSYASDMQDDFDDILFTEADEITPLDFWRESYIANTSAVFWVEVTADLGTDQLIWMYYGNSTASTTSDGEATFLLFDDFNDASFDTAKWDVKNNAPTEAGGFITCAVTATEGFASDDSFTYGKIRSNASFTADVTGSYFGKWGFLGDWVGGDVASTSFWQYNPATMRARTTSASQDVGDYDGAYYTYEIRWTVGNAEYFIDDSGLLTLTTGVYDAGSYASGYLHDKDGVLSIDWLFVGKQVETEPSVSAFGDQQVGPVWNLINTAIFYLNVPFDYWALNMGLVFGGLIIMLFSACMMAVKIRDRTITRDAGILLLFLFCVGWGLFIGGTLIG